MKFIILGQPRTGKSTLARIISNKLNIPIICTDKYRREWGYHEPFKGFDTEISPHKQHEFYNRLLGLYNSFESVILEGSAINPKDINLFKFDGIVLLYKTLNNKEMLKLCRKYDKDWTSKRDDEYLLRLFEDYIKYSNNWVLNNKNISIDTSDFYNGIHLAEERLMKQVSDKL